MFDALVARAGVAAVILSAICAIKVPAPISSAAKIIMLRMTHTHSKDPAISPHLPANRR